MIEIPNAPEGKTRVVVVPAIDDVKPFTMLVPAGYPVGLRPLQLTVGGTIEIVLYDKDPDVSIWMYGEARIFGAPTNQVITSLVAETYGYNMVGHAIITGTNDDGNSVGLTQEQIIQLSLDGLQMYWLDIDFMEHHQLIGHLLNA